MAPNPRRSVVFTARQLALLEDEAARLGISVAEMVRRIVDGYFDDDYTLAMRR
jgi:hypothetical protein